MELGSKEKGFISFFYINILIIKSGWRLFLLDN